MKLQTKNFQLSGILVKLVSQVKKYKIMCTVNKQLIAKQERIFRKFSVQDHLIAFNNIIHSFFLLGYSKLYYQL